MTDVVEGGFSPEFDEALQKRAAMREKIKVLIEEGGLSISKLYDHQNPAISDDPSF